MGQKDEKEDRKSGKDEEECEMREMEKDQKNFLL
jgi:hypothetical protein